MQYISVTTVDYRNQASTAWPASNSPITRAIATPSTSPTEAPATAEILSPSNLRVSALATKKSAKT
jgi:hypothetical protein